MKTVFRVYIEQVNQTYYDVSADTVEKSEAIARLLWKRENGPVVISVGLPITAKPGF